MSKLDFLFETALAQTRAAHRLRTLHPVRPSAAGRIWRDGREMLNFSSNDYLGLSRHPELIRRAQAFCAQDGAGALASRLVCGTHERHLAVEEKLARAKGTEAALLLACGWQANVAVIPALIAATAGQRGTCRVYTDRLNHASLHLGCQAAGLRQIRYRHNDLTHLESLLRAHATEPGARFILTESVFSMDGDQSNIPALAELADRYNAFLYLDEAHATGVLGPRGMGLSGLAPDRVDLSMGTFSKGLGSFGAYVAGSRALCNYLINHCSGFIYTTALPPAVLGAIDAAIDIVPTLDKERAYLQASAARLRHALEQAGIDCGASNTQIVPAIIGRADHTLALATALENADILAIAIRAPSVPAHRCRLRLALSAAHSDRDIDRLITTLIPLFSRAAP